MDRGSQKAVATPVLQPRGWGKVLRYVLLAIILVLTLLIVRSQRFWVFYLGER